MTILKIKKKNPRRRWDVSRILSPPDIFQYVVRFFFLFYSTFSMIFLRSFIVKKGIFCALFFCVMGYCSAGHVVADETQQQKTEAARDVEAFEKAVIDVFAEVLEWPQESVVKAYKAGAIGVTNISEGYKTGLDAVRKAVKKGLERMMQHHKLDKEAFRAMLEKSSEEQLKEKEEILQSFLAESAKLSGKDGGMGQQEGKSLHKHLTENEYRRACVDSFSEFANVPKEHVERAYHVNFFWRRQMLEELYEKNPADFKENLKDLYKYQAKMWNRDMDAVHSSFYDAIKLKGSRGTSAKVRKPNTGAPSEPCG